MGSDGSKALHISRPSRACGVGIPLRLTIARYLANVHAVAAVLTGPGLGAMAHLVAVATGKDQYLRDLSQGLGTWDQARTEAIEIEGVVDTLAGLKH